MFISGFIILALYGPEKTTNVVKMGGNLWMNSHLWTKVVIEARCSKNVCVKWTFLWTNIVLPPVVALYCVNELFLFGQCCKRCVIDSSDKYVKMLTEQCTVCYLNYWLTSSPYTLNRKVKNANIHSISHSFWLHIYLKKKKNRKPGMHFMRLIHVLPSHQSTQIHWYKPR